MLYELLTNEEKESMIDYISSYAYLDNYSNHERNWDVNLERVLRFWESDKRDLFQLFGGKDLILSKCVRFEEGIEEKTSKVYEYVLNYGAKGRPFIDAFITFAYNLMYSHKATDELFDLGVKLKLLVDPEYLANNRYEGNSFVIPVIEGSLTNTPILVSKGCKLSKVLGKIAKEYGLLHYEEFRNAHSLVTNQKFFEGDLCLSIHPLDYMTMSDNDCDWSSCMSWIEEGDYRLGTVEMMNSPCVVMAYLKAHEDMKLCDGEHTWSNKKWRTMFVVDRNMIIDIRQYPYNNLALSEIAIKWLKELAVENWKASYLDTIYNLTANKIQYIGENSTFHFNTSTGYMYPDLKSNTEHQAYIGTDVAQLGYYSFNYSGAAVCVICGDVIPYNSDEHSPRCLCCENCDPVFICSECGEYIEGEYYMVDGCKMCEECYNNTTDVCILTGERHHYDSLDAVDVIDPESGDCHCTLYVKCGLINSEEFIAIFGEAKSKDCNVLGYYYYPTVEVNFADFNNSEKALSLLEDAGNYIPASVWDKYCYDVENSDVEVSC